MSRRWWWKLLRYSPPPARALAGVLALLVVGSLMDVLRPWPLKLLVAYLLRARSGDPAELPWVGLLPGSGSPAAVVLWLAVAGVIVYSVGQAAQIAQVYVQAGLGAQMAYRLGAAVFDRAQELSPTFHSIRRVGDLVRRITSDNACVRDLMTAVLLPVLTSVGSLGLMFAIMWRLDRALALIVIAFAIPLGLLIRFLAGPMADRSYRQQELEGQMLSLAEQTLTALPVVQTFTREVEQDRQFRQLAAHTLRAYLRSITSQLLFKIATNAVTAAGTATVLIVGGFHVLAGRLTPDSLIVFLAYVASLYAPLEALAYTSTGFATASAGARRVLEVLESDQRIIDIPGAADLPMSPTPGLPVRFHSVTVGYAPDRPVLHDIDLAIAPGEFVALVGATGTGKSTLVSLIPRLADPWQGRVTVGGRDVRDLTLRSLRRHVAVVPQEPMLLPLSVRENIAYGQDRLPAEAVRSAAAAAGAAEFIQQLPQGYDTVLGERGATLSVGQRQRLAIARALARGAKVIVLDEPTSALDARTEHALADSLPATLAGRTCIVIAHRLSTIRRADRIVVLEHGRIAEQGTHDQLISRPGGIYQRLYHLQHGAPVEGTAAGATA